MGYVQLMSRKNSDIPNLSLTARVDAQGKILSNQDPKAFKAYPVVPVQFGVPTGRFDEFLFGKPNHDNMIGRAIFYASQYPEGRKLLRSITSENILFHMAAEPPLSAGAPISYIKNWNNNTHKISLFATPARPMILSFALIEETIHAHDIKKLGHANAHEHFTLRSSTIAERALEASANAGIARFAFTCHLQQKKNPRQFSPPLIMQELEIFAPELYAAGMKALPHLEAGRRDLFTQDVFRSVYEDKQLQVTYDEWRLNYYLNAFPNNKSLSLQLQQNVPNKIFMKDDSVTHETVADRLEVDGIHYLKNAPFRIDDSELTKLMDTPTIKELTKRLTARIENYDAYARQNGAPIFATNAVQSILPKGPQAIFKNLAF